MKTVHWKMIEALAQEVVERRWPYAENAPYPTLRTGNEYLYLLLDIFATEDPRFWAIGLRRCPEKGTFSYTLNGVTYYGETAARVFLDGGGPTPFRRLLYHDRIDIVDGYVWLKEYVQKMGGDSLDVTDRMTVIPYKGLQDEQLRY